MRRNERSNPFDKRVPANPRFANVEPRLSTGRKVNDVKLLSARQYLKRKDEPFFRIGAGQLHELFAEYDVVEDVADVSAASGEDVYHTYGSGSGGGGPALSPVKGGPTIVTISADAEPDPFHGKPYLIVDVRPRSDFAQGRCRGAVSVPAMHLRQVRDSLSHAAS